MYSMGLECASWVIYWPKKDDKEVLMQILMQKIFQKQKMKIFVFLKSILDFIISN